MYPNATAIHVCNGGYGFYPG
ncbi:unnamed protein product, partial [Rotaria sp. Silwood2]